MMQRRRFLSLAAAGAASSSREFGYVDWSWQRWREITRETRPQIETPQAGRGELADLLRLAGKPAAAPRDWEACRASISKVLSVFMGSPPRAKPPLEAKVLEETALGSLTRRKITFQTEPGETVPAYLFLPARARGRAPAVICPHQTTQEAKREPAGLAGDPRLHMALRLAERGYVTFSYDALCFGERHNPASGHYGDAIPFYKKHPGWSLMGKMAWDLGRAVDYLQSLDAVDPARIGSIGHSHGGYTTLFAMALDGRIAAGASSCGFDTFRYDGNTWRWSHATALLPRLGFYISSPHINMENYRSMPDSEVVETPFDLHEVLALITPRPLFLSTSDEDAIFPNRAGARGGRSRAWGRSTNCWAPASASAAISSAAATVFRPKPPSEPTVGSTAGSKHRRWRRRECDSNWR